MVTSSSTPKVFNVSINVKDLESNFDDMNKALKTAVVNTLNTVGRKSNRNISTDIKENYNIKQRSLKLGKVVRLRRADARKDVPFFTISILKKGRGLALYSPQKTPSGISVRVKKSSKVVKGSYFITSKRNQRFVARKDKKRFDFILRKTKAGKSYPARASQFLLGPSIASLYRRRKSFNIIRRTIKDNYQAELNKQFNNQFEKRRR